MAKKLSNAMESTVVPFPVEPRAIDPSRFREPRAIRLPETHVTKKPDEPKPISPPMQTVGPQPRSLLDRLKPQQPVKTPAAIAVPVRAINPPPPVRKAPRVEPIVPVRNPYDQKIDDKMDALMERAAQLDPEVATNIRFRPRLDKAVSQDATDWMNWGARSLETLRTVTEKNSQFAASYTQLNVVQWISETKNAANKPPSFLDRFSRKPVSFYETTLDRLRGELHALLTPLKQEIADLKPR